MLNRILIPIDGSQTAEAIFPQVERLLKRSDARVILVEGVTIPPQAGMDYAGLMTSLKDEAETSVRDTVKRLSGRGIDARGVVRIGGSADVILDVAEEEKVDLIAMTTHGRRGFPRFVFGSVTEKVLRASRVPVLAVRSFRVGKTGRATAAKLTALPIEKILVPIDGSEMSLGSLPAATEFAKLFGAGITLLTVLDEDPKFTVADASGQAQLRLAAKAIADAGVALEQLVRRGDPAAEILEAATKSGADLIVMSTHGFSGPTRWVLGSVAEKVLRAAPTPVLIVPTKKK